MVKPATGRRVVHVPDIGYGPTSLSRFRYENHAKGLVNSKCPVEKKSWAVNVDVCLRRIWFVSYRRASGGAEAILNVTGAH